VPGGGKKTDRTVYGKSLFRVSPQRGESDLGECDSFFPGLTDVVLTARVVYSIGAGAEKDQGVILVSFLCECGQKGRPPATRKEKGGERDNSPATLQPGGYLCWRRIKAWGGEN